MKLRLRLLPYVVGPLDNNEFSVDIYHFHGIGKISYRGWLYFHTDSVIIPNRGIYD